MLKKILSVLLCMAMVIGCITLPALADTETTWGIDNLNNEDGEIKVAFLGGSITYGGAADPRLENRYSTLVVNEFFKTRFPNKTVTEINAGIGGTPSEYGVFRTAEHIGKYAPDVVFVEFAVNDSGYVLTETGKRNVRANMEGIVRKLLSLPKIPTIIFLYTHRVHDTGDSPLAFDVDASIAEHQKIAEHYGIASINLHQHIVDEEAKGNLVWYDRDNTASTTALTNDSTHPNNKGHRVYADYITSKFNEDYKAYFKKPLTDRPHYERGYIFQNPDIVNHDDENVEYTGNWVKSDYEGVMTNSAVAVPETINTNWALSKTAGDKAVFTFTGRSIGISYAYSMIKGGIMKLTVDAGTEDEISKQITLTPTSHESYSVAHDLITRNLEYGQHTLTVENVSTDATNSYIGFAHFMTDDAEPQAVLPATGGNEDYLPEALRPANLLNDPASNKMYYDWNTTSVKLAAGTVGGATKYTFVNTSNKFDNGAYYLIEGTNVGSTTGRDSAKAAFNGYLPPNGTTNYVVEIAASKVSDGEANPLVGVGLFTAGGTTGRGIVSQEITSTDDWQTLKGVIGINCTDADNLTLRIGYDTSIIPPLNTAFQVYNASAYVAVEKEFDVTHRVSNGKSITSPGGTVTTTAQVINQIGIPGKLSQNFTYKVLNADRTAEVDCITLTSSENGNAVFTVADDAPFGDYIILASSAEYAGFRKGLKVTVADIPDYSDYVAPETRPDNLITSRATSSLYTGRNSTAVDISVPASDFYTTRFTFGGDTFQHNGYYPVEGVHANATNVNGFNGYFPTKNTNYVVEIQLKNVEPTVDASPEFAVTMFTDKTKADVRRFNVTQTDSWQTFKTTIPVEATASTTATSFLLQMGFGPKGKTPVKGTVIDFNKNAFYIAEEVAFGISANAVSSNKVEQGGTIDLEAAVLNQSGLKGYLEQDFTWIALNADRTETVSGITFASNEEGKVTATVAPTVAEGTYVILAKSSYKGIQKGISIEVTAPELVTELTIDTSVAGTASLSAKVVNSTANKIMFIIASYNGSKLSESKKEEIFVVDGQAVIEGLQIRVNAGDRIRAFIWDSKGLRPIKLRDDLVYEK